MGHTKMIPQEVCLLFINSLHYSSSMNFTERLKNIWVQEKYARVFGKASCKLDLGNNEVGLTSIFFSASKILVW